MYRSFIRTNTIILYILESIIQITNKSSAVPRIPLRGSLSNKISWLTVSKALDKSKNMPIVNSFLSIAEEILLYNCNKAK